MVYSITKNKKKQPGIIGKFIRQKRQALRLSQKSLGQLFDPVVTTQFISNVERGVTPLPPVHVPTLAKVLETSESEIMAMLEKEYASKLSGRLGLDDSPLMGTYSNGATDPSTNSPIDRSFINLLYQAYAQAETKDRETFETMCENILGVKKNAATE